MLKPVHSIKIITIGKQGEQSKNMVVIQSSP